MNDNGAPVSIEYLMHTDFAPLYAVPIFAVARGEGLLDLAAKPFVFLAIFYSVYMVHQILINS